MIAETQYSDVEIIKVTWGQSDKKYISVNHEQLTVQ